MTIVRPVLTACAPCVQVVIRSRTYKAVSHIIVQCYNPYHYDRSEEQRFKEHQRWLALLVDRLGKEKHPFAKADLLSALARCATDGSLEPPKPEVARQMVADALHGFIPYVSVCLLHFSLFVDEPRM